MILPRALALLLAALLLGPSHAQPVWRPGRVPFEIGATWVREGGCTAALVAPDRLVSNFSGASRTRVLAAPGEGLPVLASGHPLLDALHRLALEEVGQNLRPDGALMAGKEWTGIWTRDIAYSTHLALAWVAPAAAAISLRAKTFGGRVRQDTGTGGAWPVSTDRAVWTLAARELWLATGDRSWLADAHAHGVRMATEHRATARDARTGLMFGESSFMDWREQTYPAWMEPADIYQTRALGTNVVHAASWRALAQMEAALGRPAGAALWDARAAELETGIVRHFDKHDGGPLAALVYADPDGLPSGQTDALGNALAVLTGLLPAGRALAVFELYPLAVHGVPTIHPQLPHPERPYHNRSVWPFVQAYWALGAARAGHPAVFEHGLAALIRASALLLTNKENLVADTGRPEGTVVNSDRQLWSVAGFLALVHRGLFGLALAPEGLTFHPVVPAALGPRLSLSGLRLRGTVLDLHVEGHGDRLVSLSVDGRPVEPARAVPYPAPGRHVIRMRLAPRERLPVAPLLPFGRLPTAPEPPATAALTGVLPFARVGRAVRDGLESVHTRPFLALPPGWVLELPVTTAHGVPVERWPGAEALTISVTVPASGLYAVRARYANGAGPINSDSRCALRALSVDGRRAGVLVFPQRGAGAWHLRGLSSALALRLGAGTHRLALAPDPLALNMEGEPGVLSLHSLELSRQE